MIDQMYPVSSTNMTAVGYDSERSVMRVEFPNGALCEYSDVPVTVFDELVNAEGYHGEFFSKFIKNQYPYTRIN